MEGDADARAYDALSQHARLADLAAIARSVMTAAAETRRPERSPGRVTDLAKELGIAREDASTPFGNALDVLERGPEDDAERALARALAAQVVATQPPKDRDEEDRLAGDLLWLATHTPFDATGLLDHALGDAATSVWDAVADRIRRIDEGKTPMLGRGEALVGAAALSTSTCKGAIAQAAALAADVRDRKIARVLGGRAGSTPDRGGANAISPARTVSAPEATETVAGEMAPAPRGPVATALLAVTGILLALQLARLVGGIALAYRRPAQLSLSDDGGVRVKWRTELLGRTLLDRDVLVPRAALARATRDVRYPGIALYAGLLALAVGSYLGVSAFVDGVRAASPSLLASGLGIVAVGLALDFALTSLAPGARGRCRVLLVSRDGTRLCVGSVDPKRADAVLARLART